MITVEPATKNLLKTGLNVSTSASAELEYNLNSMVEHITATSSALTNTFAAAFKKLFPIDTIYKPFRPVSPGIKYLVHTDGFTDTKKDSFENPRNIEMGTNPRLYYPGPDMVYKYWLAPKNTNIDISLEYFSDEAKTTAKLIPVNKIVARFETGHDTPISWVISVVKQDNTVVNTPGTYINSSGEATIYYNGTAWSTTKPDTYTTTQYVKKISLTAVNSNTGKFLGVIELSPRWVLPVDSDIVSLSINKETTSDDNSIVPVGIITANYLNLTITKPPLPSKKIFEYDRASTSIDNTKVYLFKNVIIRPYINIGNSSSSEKVPQGTFYINSWTLSEFGEASIDATDAAKILQDTLCPQLFVENSPATSVIKRVLDSIGFSNYKINVTKADSEVDVTSIPSFGYWWSDGDKTVWEVLQEICRDIQMNAFVDEYNVLNFYSRNVIYDKTITPKWTFTSENINTGGVLDYAPNIISLSTKELFSANQVRVRYSTAFSSSNSQSSSPLWKSDTSFLGAGALAKKIELNNTVFELNPNTVNTARTDRIMDQFSGYVLINGEVIEYDGIWYQYTPAEQNTTVNPPIDKPPVEVLIKNQSDIWKYSVLAKPGFKYFQPLNKYQIKTRGALSTKVPPAELPHLPAPEEYINKEGENNSKKFNQKKIILASVDPATSSIGVGSIKNVRNSDEFIKKGYLTVSNPDFDKSTFTMVLKEFDTIDLSDNYLSFGTRMFFDSQLSSQAQVAGIGFCLDADGKNGYYVLIRTTAYAELQKDIMIVRVKNNKLTVLKDSQQVSTKTLSGIYAGASYVIDALVKKESLSSGATRNIITVFINGYKITANDTGSDSVNNYIPPVSFTKNVGLHCGQGTAYFEFLYAKSLDEKKYLDKSERAMIQYNGVYSDDTLSMLYGDLIYNSGEVATVDSGAIFEFGTTAREIKKTKVSYDDRPALPIQFRTSLNKYVTVLAEKLQPFGAESYVLNNTSVTVALDDSNNTTFYVLGNSIQRSGAIDYDTDQSTDSANKESVVFDSSWIQSESDAKSLAEWIKSTILNKGRAVNMTVFGNPIISAGDIVTINYPLVGIDTSSNKYVVTRCTLDYKEGLSTSISCRAI
jgi:hypothetical protein